LGDPEKAPNEFIIRSGRRGVRWYPAAQVLEVGVGRGVSQYGGGLLVQELAADLVNLV
jgi:hypothetical protein